MTKEALISKDATSEQFFSFITDCLDPELVASFVEIGEYDTDFETLNAFLKSEMIKNRLLKGWEAEKPVKWPSRSVELSITQTFGHFISLIMGDIELYYYRRKGALIDLDIKEVYRISENTQFLKDFFGIRFRNIKGHSS